MDRYMKFLLAAGAGMLVSAIGVELIGYLSAIAVPEEYFVWFQENLSLNFGFALLYTFQYVAGFGLLLLAAGYLVTKGVSLYPVAAVSCLLIGFWLYLVVGVSLVYGGPMINPVPEINLSVIILLVTHILFPVVGVVLGKWHNRAISATDV